MVQIHLGGEQTHWSWAFEMKVLLVQGVIGRLDDLLCLDRAFLKANMKTCAPLVGTVEKNKVETSYLNV